jgi:hypothetical protein
MTRRAKIAAEHRDAVADNEPISDAPSTGSKRARKSPRPWIVEYCAKKNTQKEWFLFKHDGQWHKYGYHNYTTERAALAAMRTFRLQQESLTKLSKGTFARNLAWRVTNAAAPPPTASDGGER